MSTPSIRPLTTTVRSGSGLLARTDSALLFVPEADAEVADLFDVFLAATDAVNSLGAHLVDLEFSCTPFALVDWQTEVVLMVFGPIEVSTDQPSLPMLSGAGSATWVEHRLRATTGIASITVNAPDPSPTDLRAGIVPAGGFRLDLDLDPAAEPTRVADEGEEPARAYNPAPPQMVPAAPPAITMSPIEATPPPPEGVVLADPSPPPVDEARVDLPPPPVDMAQGGRPDPEATILPSDLTSIGGTSAHSPGLLRFDDGRELPLNSSYEIGRRPAPESPDVKAFAVSGQKVSRRHVRVIVRDTEVFVEDLGSSNGTRLISQPGAEPEDLDPGSTHSLQPGAIVHLGACYFTYLTEPPG